MKIPLLGQKPTEYFPVWFAIAGDKIVCAQEQAFVVEAFQKRYGRSPDLVINGLYAAKEANKYVANNDRGGGLGQG